jgi:hypothetical protein
MNAIEIAHIQRVIGTVSDGIWGKKSRAACIDYLRSLMPESDNTPTPDDKSMIAIYGQPGVTSNLTPIKVTGLGVMYDTANVETIRVHKLAAPSLLAAIKDIAASSSAWVLKEYAGCYNDRSMRGGKRKSKHAWGVAIDLAPKTNGLKTRWPEKANMPINVMEAFARQGWISAGAEWGIDAMHFERTS